MAIENQANSGKINRSTVNPTVNNDVNSNPFNTFPINGATNATITPKSGSGTLLSLEQTIAHIGSGIVLSLEQEIELLEQGSGTLVSIEQSLEATGSGTLVSMEQRVWDANTTNRVARRGHDVAIFLDSYELPAAQLHGTMEVEFNEDAAAVARFTLLPGSGVQDLSFYYGKSVIINITKSDKTTYRVFTGVVDIVDFDIIDGKTHLECTNRRKELLNAIPSPETKFGSPFDTSLIVNLQGSSSEKIDKLLPFADKSLDFDAYNNWHYTSWTPKSTADITLAAAGVFRRDPSFDLVNRGTIVNEIAVTFNYSFKRLQYAEAVYSWNAPYSNNGANFSVVLEDGYSLTSRDSILAAIEGTGWKVKGAVTFGGLPPQGFYGGIIWTGDSKQESTRVSTDDDGNNITDNNGNNVIETYTRRSFDQSGLHATSAAFTLTNRWSQDVIKQFNLTVSSSTSKALFGTVARTSSYSVGDEYDTDRWDNYERWESSYQAAPGITLDLGSGDGYTNITTKENLVNSNIRAAIDKARIEILKAHRENTVTAQTDILPELQLPDTLEINAPGKLQTKGKVSKYTHHVDFNNADAWTEFELKLYFLGAGGTDDKTTLPNNPATTTETIPTAPTLDSFYGKDPNAAGFLKKAGFFGNRYNTVRGDTQLTSYQEQFRIDTPAIQAEMTDAETAAASKSYDINIPSGTLTVTYD